MLSGRRPGREVSLDDLFPDIASPYEALFGEAPGGFLISAPPDSLRALAASAPDASVALRPLGTVSGDSLQIALGDLKLSATLNELIDAHASLHELFL